MQKLLCLTVILVSSTFAITPIANVKTTYPQKLSTEMGVVIGSNIDAGWNSGDEGIVLSIEPGYAGTKLHVGVGKVSSGIGGFSSLRVTGTYLNMYNRVDNFYDSGNFYGAEVALSLGIFTTNVGYLHSFNKSRGSYTIGIGFGW